LADNRFLDARKDLQTQMNVDLAMKNRIEHGRQNVKENPTSAQAVLSLSYSLLQANQFEELLALLDDAIGKERNRSGAKHYYDDHDDTFVWLLDNRFRALRGLGRWDEAIEQEQRASHFSENDKDNVSQVINLSAFYVDLGRANDAKKALAGLGEGAVSKFGAMQVAAVLLAAAAQQKDAKEVDNQLAYLQKNNDEAVDTYQEALVVAGHIDQAAALLVGRLADTEQRTDALMYVQSYQSGRMTDWQKTMAERRQSLVARKDVQEAIKKVGSAARYNIRPMTD
jgi:tetratricopeptide (TPR) repeat protein